MMLWWTLAGCGPLVVEFPEPADWVTEADWTAVGQRPIVRSLTTRYVIAIASEPGSLEVLVLDRDGVEETRLPWSLDSVELPPYDLAAAKRGTEDQFTLAWVEGPDPDPALHVDEVKRIDGTWTTRLSTHDYEGETVPSDLGLMVEIGNPRAWIAGCSTGRIALAQVSDGLLAFSHGLDHAAGTVCFVERPEKLEQGHPRACEPGVDCRSYLGNGPLDELNVSDSDWDDRDIAIAHGHGDLVVAVDSEGAGRLTPMEQTGSTVPVPVFADRILDALDGEMGDTVVAAALTRDSGSPELIVAVGDDLEGLTEVSLEPPDMEGLTPSGVGVASLDGRVLLAISGEDSASQGVVRWSLQDLP